MAISVSTPVENNTPADPLSIDPAAVANDVLISGAFARASGVTFAWPASFDQIAIESGMSEAGGTLAVARKKVATGSEGALSINPTAAIIGFIMRLAGADNVNTEDVASVLASDLSSDASPWIIEGSITPITNGCLIVAVMGDDTDGDGNASHVFTTQSGTTGAWTTRSDQFGTGGYNLSVGTAEQATAGAITVRGTGTAGGNSAQRAMVLMAIRPSGIVLPTARMRGQRPSALGVGGLMSRTKAINWWHRELLRCRAFI